MQSDHNPSKVLRSIVDETPYTAMDVFGHTIELISDPDDPGADFCVMRAVMPPGAVVPLHSHDHHEDILILAGTEQVFVEDAHGLQWREVQAGDYVHIPAGIMHAHRTISDEPAVDLVISTAKLGRFFRELARPDVGPRERIALSTKYGYILGTPEQNAAVGIELGLA